MIQIIGGEGGGGGGRGCGCGKTLSVNVVCLVILKQIYNFLILLYEAMGENSIIYKYRISG